MAVGEVHGSTGEAACAMASAPFQFSQVNAGFIEIRLPSCNLPESCPPTALPSVPIPEISMNRSCMPVSVKFLNTGFAKSKENFSVNPSGLRSLSKVNGVRNQENANLPPVSDSHLCACGW